MNALGVDDRYTYPGSGGVLRNQLGITSHDLLDEAMNDFATLGWAVMSLEPVPITFDFSYLCQIHHRLLGDIVGDEVVGHWAGQIRNGAAPLGAMGTGIPYAIESFMQSGLDDVFGQLKQKNYLTNLDQQGFFSALAEIWGYLTQIHPFRDGNTRSQTAFCDRLAVNAGHPVDWLNIDVNELREKRLQAITNSSHLARYLETFALPTKES
ncbi:Fic/DOC family protein [Paeniglutamicibacter gangotriensis]|uniref:Fic/DOC family protein n=1 Tax=Paeniglutamicibacter gangotriensis TaxID=254787 RepID=UPI0021D1D0AC|nr:Fic family protein [Paeniglutamicibacter gangotriensis]